ncbi:MAG: hypothetical protein LBH08_03435 [Puniceicoccales bacterium]|jgi:hypothetical protein|nr:hypothetical protein [Puniceicoccales bacterium]
MMKIKSAKVVFGACLTSFCFFSYATVPLDSTKNAPPLLLPPLPPVPTGNYWHLLWIFLGLLLLILFAFWGIKKILKKRSAAEITLTSFQQFLKDLHKARLNMGERNAKYFCSALCDALKSYLQREYKLPITCRTTEEFLKIFGKSAKFSWEKVSMLSDILQYSDIAKFAGEDLSFDLQRDLFLKTCYFSRDVRRAQRQSKSMTSTPSAL